MNEQQPNANAGTEGLHHEANQTPPPDSPKIYVASLSDYNAGRLHGVWLDAAVETDALRQQIGSMLAASSEPGAEEYAIHDYEGFGPLKIHEYASIESVARIAQGVAEHGVAFAHWASTVGSDEIDSLDNFDEAYRGHFDDVESYANDLIESIGWEQDMLGLLPEFMQAYVKIDVEAFARDLELSGDITVSLADGGGVFIFEGNL